MCGRFYITKPHPEAILAQLPLPLKFEDKHVKTTGEIFPSDIVLIIAVDHGKVLSAYMQWGFPGWKPGQFIINAKAETAHEKPMFREALQHRRMVAPAAGFFEWRPEPGQKQKQRYLFTEQECEHLFLAGIWNQFESPKYGPIEEHFTILTTAANNCVTPYHHRMPVIIKEAEIYDWLMTDNPAKYLNRCQTDLNVQAMPSRI